MPLTVLVAEDDLGTRLSVTDYLSLNGFTVIAAANGQDALRQIEQYRPHLIVTDIAMPKMDGYEVVRQVRSQPALRLLPVVFLTARDDTPDRIRGYQLGCDAYLAKPFELEELLAVVRNLLDRAQSVALELQFSRSQSLPPRSYNQQSHSRQSHSRQSHSSNLQNSLINAEDIGNLPELSAREIEVLNHLSTGESNIQIGKELHLSPRTIEKHVSSLLRKAAVQNRSELVRYAIEHNLVE